MINISNNHFFQYNYKYDNVQRYNRTLTQDIFSKRDNIMTDKKKSYLSGNNKISFKGWKPENKKAEQSIKEIVDLIKNPNNKRIAISGHVSSDGDCIGAGFALANMIQQATGKRADLFVFGDLSHKYEFLNKNNDINVINIYGNKDFKPDKLKEKYGQYDIAIAVDVALKRLLAENYYEGIFSPAKTTVRIDHHPYMKTFDKEAGCEVDNNFADYNYSDTTCNSATQILMQFTDAFGINPKTISKQTNEALYTGIITDTDNFKYAQTAKPLLDTALLMENGVDNIDMQSKLNGNVPFIIYKVRQHLYDNIKYTPDNKIAYFVENEETAKLKTEAQQLGCKDEVQNEIINTIESLIKLQGVEIAMKIMGTNFSVRSKNADISKLAMKYGGGGHKNASAFCVKKEKSTPAETVIENILNEYQEELKIQEKERNGN